MRRSGNALKTALRLPNQKLSWSPNENEKKHRSGTEERVARLSAAYTMARDLRISFRVKVIIYIYTSGLNSELMGSQLILIYSAVTVTLWYLLNRNVCEVTLSDMA